MPPHPFADRWNHNTHYYPLIRQHIPNEASTILDIGAGEGRLARFLVRPGRTVISIDPDSSVLPESVPGLDFRVGSAERLPFADASIDAVTMVMVLHHTDAHQALAEVTRVLRPGGAFVLLGMAVSTSRASDAAWELRDVISQWLHRIGKTAWEPETVKLDPALRWQETYALLERELPGIKSRRLPMWRFLSTWTSPTSPAEVPLDSDGSTKGIVRIGDTVRRPSRPFTVTVQQYLAHLHERGFSAAPIPMGFDEQGREILSYVAGEVPHEPVPDWATSIRVLEDIARLVRRLHDAAQGWEPPADAVWGSIPGDLPPGFVPLFDEPELVAHADYCPGNVVFRNGLPCALIDFDLARPTTRMADAVNALYWWVPLRDPIDRPPALVDADGPGPATKESA